MTILVATGLLRERRLLDGPGATVIAGGGDARRLEAALEQLAGRAEGIISIGIAGGLSPDLRSGRWIVATAVWDEASPMPTDVAWTQRLLGRLAGATTGTIAGADAIVDRAAQKAALYRATGASAVDMESHIAGRVAGRFHLPFAAARVVSDPAHRSLPPAVRVGMRSDGAIDVPAVLRSVVEQPSQLLALIGVAIEAERSFRSLLRGRRLLGAGLCGPDVRQLPGNVI